MDVLEAWERISKALDAGLQAAHGAGMISRQEVADVGAAERLLVDHLNATAKENAELRAANEGLAKQLGMLSLEPGATEGEDSGDTSGTNPD